VHDREKRLGLGAMTYVSTFASSRSRGESAPLATLTAVATVSFLRGINLMTLAAVAVLVDKRCSWLLTQPKPAIVAFALALLLANYGYYGRDVRHRDLMAAYQDVEGRKPGICRRRAVGYAVSSFVCLAVACVPLYGTIPR
jgi:hypothetical protein